MEKLVESLNSKIKEIFQHSSNIQYIIDDMHSEAFEFKSRPYRDYCQNEKLHFDVKVRILAIHKELLNFAEECYHFQSFLNDHIDKDG